MTPVVAVVMVVVPLQIRRQHQTGFGWESQSKSGEEEKEEDEASDHHSTVLIVPPDSINGADMMQIGVGCRALTLSGLGGSGNFAEHPVIRS